jgi:hypothetical protein
VQLHRVARRFYLFFFAKCRKSGIPRSVLMSFEELHMSAVKAKRGRPTGSGINDRIWLRELGHLIRINPATRATAAIKALGITDPSTIRRLREKHKRMTPNQGV